MRKGLLLLLLHAMAIGMYAQDCPEIPENQNWSGQTINGTGGKYGKASNLTVVKIADKSYTISDFSAGLLNTLGYSSSNPLDFKIDCNGNIIASEQSTDFGDLSISGGSWDKDKRKLILHWSIPYNKVTESSEFIF